MSEWIPQLKVLLRESVGLSPWIALVGVGLASHVFLNLRLQRSITSAGGLLLPAGLGIALETYEIWVQYRDVGLFAAGNDPIVTIVARHLKDVFLLLAAPLALVVYGRL